MLQCTSTLTSPISTGAPTDQFELQKVIALIRVDPEQRAVRFCGAEADCHQVASAVRPPIPLVFVLDLTAPRTELVADRLCGTAWERR